MKVHSEKVTTCNGLCAHQHASRLIACRGLSVAFLSRNPCATSFRHLYNSMSRGGMVPLPSAPRCAAAGHGSAPTAAPAHAAAAAAAACQHHRAIRRALALTTAHQSLLTTITTAMTMPAPACYHTCHGLRRRGLVRTSCAAAAAAGGSVAAALNWGGSACLLLLLGRASTLLESSLCISAAISAALRHMNCPCSSF